MTFRIAALVATSVTLVTLAVCSFFVLPSAVQGTAGGAVPARTAGTLSVRGGNNERTANQNLYYANASTRDVATAADQTATVRGADRPHATAKTLIRPGPGTCVGMSLGGFWMTGFLYGLALGPEGAALVGAGMLAYGVISAAIC